MSDQYTNEPMLDMFIFETSQLLGQLEQAILSSEKSSCFTAEAINEIFRIMHTIKGSSAMMLFNGISVLAHSIEDLFYFLREEKPYHVNCSGLSDLVLEGIDFIKIETEKIKNSDEADGNATKLIENIKSFLSALQRDNISTDIINSGNSKKPKQRAKQKKQIIIENQQYYITQNKAMSRQYKNMFKGVIHFEEGCEMENIRGYTIIHNLKDITDAVFYLPEDIIDNDESVEVIRKDGFTIFLKADYNYAQMHEFFMQTIFLKNLELVLLQNDEEFKQFSKEDQDISLENSIKTPSLQQPEKDNAEKEIQSSVAQQSIISVSVAKLDSLMDLVGEMVIAEAMVLQNPDLKGLELDNFQKSARQLNKITSEIQDVVMSIRMVPLSITFYKMQRVVRDMCKKLNKDVHLDIIGEDTEVDKKIIEHISDPLMHLVRNAIDHGIETTEERIVKGKSQRGRITLEAKSVGSDVLILVKDNGKGLNKEKILKKARENGLLHKSEEDMSDKEIFNLIFLAGFSTKDSVTEFSGRGVGMDIVTKNIETVGGSVSVDSRPEKGTTISLKIPLTLAIIDGINIKVGNSRYTIPTISIKESFRPKEADVFTDPDGNEMIMVRGQCYKVLRIHELYEVKTNVTNFSEGILIMVEQDDKAICLFADELIGQQQVVVKTLPEYIRSFKKTTGLAGCTLLGDGSISLIMDIGGLVRF